MGEKVIECNRNRAVVTVCVMQQSALQVTMTSSSRKKILQPVFNNLFTGCQACLSAESHFHYLLQHTVIYMINCLLYGEIQGLYLPCLWVRFAMDLPVKLFDAPPIKSVYKVAQLQ
jgi:hypothetical protein